MPAMVSPRKTSRDSRRWRARAEGVMLVVLASTVVLWMEVAIYLGHASCRPCGDCRTVGLVIQVTAGQGKANPFLPWISQMSADQKQRPLPQKDPKERKGGRSR